MNNIEELINNAMLSSLEGYAFLVADSIEFELNRKLTTTEHQQVFVAVEHVASGNSALLAKLEAAELELIKPLPISELIHRLESQTYEKWFGESDVKDLRERAEAAEARLLVPVKLPESVIVNISGKYPIDVMYVSRVKKAICAAGYPVEGGE